MRQGGSRDIHGAKIVDSDALVNLVVRHQFQWFEEQTPRGVHYVLHSPSAPLNVVEESVEVLNACHVHPRGTAASLDNRAAQAATVGYRTSNSASAPNHSDDAAIKRGL